MDKIDIKGKMTDEQIIEALQHCGGHITICDGCPYDGRKDCGTQAKEDIIKRLNALNNENAELKARLENAVELPCKIGDTIYQTDTNGTRIFKSTVKNIIFETDGVAFDERAIGESIFLTEEAVKEKMKKLKEKNND